MGRWSAVGGLDVESGCVEGATTKSGGGRGSTTSQQPATPSNIVRREEGREGKREEWAGQFKSVYFR
jgi:hypothetical protein